MKKFTNKVYKDIPEPENFTELLNLIFNSKVLSYAENLRMWRGQSNIEWKVDSAAYRRISITSSSETTDDILKSYEQYLLNTAKHKGYHIISGRILSDFELLSLLQHNGAATRLVDFTRSAFIGLWFCVCDNMDLTGLFLGCHTNYLGGYEGEREERPYTEVVKDLHKYNNPVTWEPTSITARIAAQHSQFLYSHVSDSRYGSLKLSEDENANLFIAITPKLKLECKNMLNQVFDINEQTLFPDIYGFSQSNSPYNHTDDMFRW